MHCLPKLLNRLAGLRIYAHIGPSRNAEAEGGPGEGKSFALGDLSQM